MSIEATTNNSTLHRLQGVHSGHGPPLSLDREMYWKRQHQGILWIFSLYIGVHGVQHYSDHDISHAPNNQV